MLHPRGRVRSCYIRERNGRQIGKRGSDLQDQEGQDGQRGGQNIVDKMKPYVLESNRLVNKY